MIDIRRVLRSIVGEQFYSDNFSSIISKVRGVSLSGYSVIRADYNRYRDIVSYLVLKELYREDRYIDLRIVSLYELVQIYFKEVGDGFIINNEYLVVYEGGVISNKLYKEILNYLFIDRYLNNRYILLLLDKLCFGVLLEDLYSNLVKNIDILELDIRDRVGSSVI